MKNINAIKNYGVDFKGFVLSPDDRLMEGLKRKGFYKEDIGNLKDFATHRCKVFSYSDSRDVYTVDGEPFLAFYPPRVSAYREVVEDRSIIAEMDYNKGTWLYL